MLNNKIPAFAGMTGSAGMAASAGMTSLLFNHRFVFKDGGLEAAGASTDDEAEAMQGPLGVLEQIEADHEIPENTDEAVIRDALKGVAQGLYSMYNYQRNFRNVEEVYLLNDKGLEKIKGFHELVQGYRNGEMQFSSLMGQISREDIAHFIHHGANAIALAKARYESIVNTPNRSYLCREYANAYKALLQYQEDFLFFLAEYKRKGGGKEALMSEAAECLFDPHLDEADNEEADHEEADKVEASLLEAYKNQLLTPFNRRIQRLSGDIESLADKARNLRDRNLRESMSEKLRQYGASFSSRIEVAMDSLALAEDGIADVSYILDAINGFGDKSDAIYNEFNGELDAFSKNMKGKDRYSMDYEGLFFSKLARMDVYKVDEYIMHSSAYRVISKFFTENQKKYERIGGYKYENFLELRDEFHDLSNKYFGEGGVFNPENGESFAYPVETAMKMWGDVVRGDRQLEDVYNDRVVSQYVDKDFSHNSLSSLVGDYNYTDNYLLPYKVLECMREYNDLAFKLFKEGYIDSVIPRIDSNLDSSLWNSDVGPTLKNNVDSVDSLYQHFEKITNPKQRNALARGYLKKAIYARPYDSQTPYIDEVMTYYVDGVEDGKDVKDNWGGIPRFDFHQGELKRVRTRFEQLDQKWLDKKNGVFADKASFSSAEEFVYKAMEALDEYYEVMKDYYGVVSRLSAEEGVVDPHNGWGYENDSESPLGGHHVDVFGMMFPEEEGKIRERERERLLQQHPYAPSQ